MSNIITRKQQADQCIAIIKDWKNHTERAMDAVQRLHDDKLWKELNYDSFRDAITIGCGINKTWGYELLKTAQARKQLTAPQGVHSVNSGSASLQPLTKAEAATITPAIRKVLDGIPTAKQVEAVRAAASVGRVTARAVREQVAGGKQKVDPRLFVSMERELGAVLRRIDDLHRHTPHQEHHDRAIQLVKDAMKEVKEWQREAR